MKTVYIELFFLDNILINFYFLYLSGAIYKYKINYKAGLLSAFIGALYGYFQLKGVWLLNLLILKIALSAVMIYVSYRPSRKVFFKLLFTFYALSFAFGGIILGIFYTSKKDSLLRSAFAIPIPMRIAMLIMLWGHFLKKYLIRSIALLTYCKQGISLRLTCFGAPVTLPCYSDTGNVCSYFSKPVVFVNKNKIPKIQEVENTIEGNISKGGNNINIVYIPYKTAGGDVKTAPGFKCENAALQRGTQTKELCVYIALTDHDFDGEPCLINPLLLD